jgi:formate transporter
MESPSSGIDALLPPEIARRAEDAGVQKASLDAARTFVLAILAGAFIGLGAAFSTTVTTGLSIGYGLVRLVAGLTFSLGLVLVVLAGAELFTGNNLVVMAFASRRVTLGRLLRNWTIVYAGNFAGAVATAGVVAWSGPNSHVTANALAIAAAKCRLGFAQAVALGILCNALVCLAVWICLGARSSTDKILSVLFPVTAFVACGFEHSVANMYFVPLGMMLRDRVPGDFAALTWPNFLVANLLPVTLGNIIGGAGMVGLVYWFIYRRPGGDNPSR